MSRANAFSPDLRLLRWGWGPDYGGAGDETESSAFGFCFCLSLARSTAGTPAVTCGLSVFGTPMSWTARPTVFFIVKSQGAY